MARLELASFLSDGTGARYPAPTLWDAAAAWVYCMHTHCQACNCLGTGTVHQAVKVRGQTSLPFLNLWSIVVEMRGSDGQRRASLCYSARPRNAALKP